MNISPVSFRNTVNATPRTNFDALISRPQTYSHTEKPTAATNIEGEKKKKSPLKKLLGLVVTAGVIAAGLALGAKHGVFNPKENGNKYIETAKSGLKVVGDKILELGNKAITAAKSQFENIKTTMKEKMDSEKISDAVEDAVGDVAGDAAKDVVKNAVEDAVGDVAGDAAKDVVGDAAKDAVVNTFQEIASAIEENL